MTPKLILNVKSMVHISWSRDTLTIVAQIQSPKNDEESSGLPSSSIKQELEVWIARSQTPNFLLKMQPSPAVNSNNPSTYFLSIHRRLDLAQSRYYRIHQPISCRMISRDILILVYKSDVNT